jgi:hypothetical protein
MDALSQCVLFAFRQSAHSVPCVALLFHLQADDSYVDFFIGHFKEYPPDGNTNPNRTYYSADYDDVTDYRHQCRIDDIRVPVCLGLSFPLLFLAAFGLYKRSLDHFDSSWRRACILFLVIFGGFMFLACEFWWQGCHNFAKGAVLANGTPALRDVTFAGSELQTQYSA